MGIRRYIGNAVEKKLEPRLSSIEAQIRDLLELHQSSEVHNGFNLAESSDHTELHRLVHSQDDVRFHREWLSETLGSKGLCLEIGPYFHPIVYGENARYFDVFDTEELRRRAKLDPNPIVTEDTVPQMHYSNSDGDISIIKEDFTDVVSSHCIEHQPDFISHLEKVYDLLEPGGRYVAFVPDKRYCFDHFSPISTIGDVLGAEYDQLTRHSLASVVNLIAGATHNDPKRHWAGDHTNGDYFLEYGKRVTCALEKYEDAAGDYIDCHAWYFTPNSLAHICETLFQMKKIRLQLEDIGNTRINTQEFSAVFRRN